MPRQLARVVLIAGGVAALAAAAAWLWRDVRGHSASDFYMYYVAGNREDRGRGENIYSFDYKHRIGEEELARAIDSGSRMHHEAASAARTPDIVSSPFLYTCFVWLPRDYERALAQYRVVQLASFVLAVLLLGRAVRLPLPASLFITAALLRFFHPLHADLLVGNVNAFQLAVMAALVSVAPRFPLAGGAILGLLLSFKPTVLYVVVLLVLARVATRDWGRLGRELAGGAAGVGVAWMAAAVNFGTPRVWLDWIPVAGGFYGRLPGRESNNVSPALALFEKWGSSVSFAIAAVLVMATALVLFRRRASSDVHLVGAGVLIYLLSAPVVWMHYIVLAVVPAMALLGRKWSAPLGAASLIAICYRAVIDPGGGLQPLPQHALTPALLMLFVAVVAGPGGQRLGERRY